MDELNAERGALIEIVIMVRFYGVFTTHAVC